MTTKRDLHTLFIKHDTDFGTLSKKALSEVLLKIIFLQKGGAKFKQIKAELESIISGTISDASIHESLLLLLRNDKITSRRERYSIHPNILPALEISAKKTIDLQDRIFTKYLRNCKSSNGILKQWFQDTLIQFFENFSLEWFNHLSKNGKLAPKKIDNNISSAIDEMILKYADKIDQGDYEFLKNQFIKFYESEEADENIMFWNFGISLFSSRVITARNYADKVSIDTFKNGCFILDTNILMILDLDGHELEQSFIALDKIFHKLNIKTKYLYITGEEYKRAISSRKADTISVFESYSLDVLKNTKCPFVQTAIKRGCVSTVDVERMFETLYDVPKSIASLTKIECIDFNELAAEIENGKNDEILKSKIEEIHFRRLKRNKRENPKIHDAGLIYGVNYLRKSDQTWILTTDGTLKVYAIENTIGNETEIAIGLDALIGMFAVNGGGVEIDSSDFAPLFKNLIKHSLIPEENVFDVRDLAFMLSTNHRINDLENDKIIEIANDVRKMRISGSEDEEISLFLRREIEGQKLSIVKDLGQARASESIASMKAEKAEKERDFAFEKIRNDRQAELRNQYDRQLRINRILLITIPLTFSVCVFLALKYGMKAEQNIQYIVGCSVEFIFGIIPYWPINKRFVRKHSEYVRDINKIVENEIFELKRNSKI